MKPNPYMNSQNSRGVLPRSSRLNPAEPAIDFRRIRHLLRERALFIVLGTLAFVALACVYLALKPAVYASVATLIIEQQDRKVVNTLLDSQDVTQNDLHTLDVMKTVEQSLTSDALELRVIRANGLATNPHFVPARPGRPYSDDEMLLAFSKRVTVKLRRGTRLIDVTAESESPLLAKQVAQSLVNEYLRDGADQAAGVSKSTDGYLTEEAAQLKAKLEKSEKDLQDYREQNNALSLEDKQNIVVETLKDLNLKLNTARTARMKLEADNGQYQQLAGRDPKALLALSSIAEAVPVMDAGKRVADQQGQLAALTRHFRAEHPKYIQAQSQFAQAQDDLNRAITKAGETIPSAYHAALDNEQKLEAALHDQEKVSSELNKMAIPYNVLVREVESNRALYQPILNRLKQNAVAQALAVNPVRIAESARITSEPVRPKKLLVLLASVAAGLVVSVGWCLARDAADTSLKTVDQAESALNLSVICAVPRLSRRKRARAGSEIVMVSEPSSPTAEAFRSLRTVLGLNDTGAPQLVLVTSAMPDEGKTFCSVNCAVALAQQGYRTLLVDADLRRPSIAGLFGRDPKAPGFTNYLAGEVALTAAIQGSEIENLSLLPAGTTARNPAELLSNARLTGLFSNPGFAAFDRVVFDTAPVNAVSDALALVRHVSTVCLVVRAGTTPSQASRRAHAALTAAGATDVGVALNGLPLNGGSDCFYHYASIYGSEGVYGAEKPAKA